IRSQTVRRSVKSVIKSHSKFREQDVLKKTQRDEDTDRRSCILFLQKTW
ncbi:unnamed protein product, partial [Callosobruchus maculatus]